MAYMFGRNPFLKCYHFAVIGMYNRQQHQKHIDRYIDLFKGKGEGKWEGNEHKSRKMRETNGRERERQKFRKEREREKNLRETLDNHPNMYCSYDLSQQ